MRGGAHGVPAGYLLGCPTGVTLSGVTLSGGKPLHPTLHGGEPYMYINDAHSHIMIGIYAGT